MQEKNEPSKTQFVKRYDVDGGRGVVAAFRYIKDGKKIQSFHGFSTRYGKVKKYRITYVDDAAIRGASPDAPELTNQQAMYNVPQSAPAVNTAEYTDVYNRYHNADGTKKPGWMKAPNGKPTKLTEEQWVWVRTPNFKKWFGDWEALAEVEAMKQTLADWTSTLADFEWAKGKTLAESESKFGNEKVAIAYIPKWQWICSRGKL